MGSLSVSGPGATLVSKLSAMFCKSANRCSLSVSSTELPTDGFGVDAAGNEQGFDWVFNQDGAGLDDDSCTGDSSDGLGSDEVASHLSTADSFPNPQL